MSSGGGVPTPCTRRRSPFATRGIAHSTRGRILSGRRSTFSGYLTSGILSSRRSTFSGYLTSGILSGRRSTFSKYLTSGILSVNVPPSLDISHPALDVGWERRAFQLPQSDMSGSFDSAYSESFSLSIQCHGVLLKLPDMCDRHFEIFCFRYLMSKSPNSPYNPPIIGFLSL